MQSKLGALAFSVLLAGRLPCQPASAPSREEALRQASANGRLAAEGLARCRRFVTGWLRHADPGSGLIPRNLRESKDIWNAKDSAADNYPFMVLTAAITDRGLFSGPMLDILKKERSLTSRLGPLPDTWSFSRQAFQDEEPDLGRIIFGASEYIKDGLLPLTEWLGPSPWSERLLEMLDEMWRRAPVGTARGPIVSDDVEVNGEMLQTLSRVYWMTGDRKYLDWALRLGDHYLLDGHHPTRNAAALRLRDHGCEIVSGLCELYATCHFALPERKSAYRGPVHEMLDRILEVGRNPHGMLYNWIEPRTGAHDRGLCDTWGYNLNGHYTVFLLDGTEAYREAARKALGCLYDHYRGYRWEGQSADGYADSIESALNLFNREPVPAAARWIDGEIQVMWGKQGADGVVEGWHGDGNFARTTIMYCLWKSQGVTVRPWRGDLACGAVRQEDGLVLVLRAGGAWQGRLLFDVPRHRVFMKLPLDWPRINQFPEWFTVAAERIYTVQDLAAGTSTRRSGRELQEGIEIRLEPEEERRLLVR